MANAKKKNTQGAKMKKRATTAVVHVPKPKVARPLGAPGSYAQAVSTPFARSALGARVPDGSPLPLATVLLTQKIQIQSNASGELDLVVLPNLITSCFSTRASNSGGELVQLANTATTAGLKTPVTATARAHGFDGNALSNMYTNYRIVSMGVRLKAIAGINTTGEFVTAVHALRGYAPQRAGATIAVTDPAGALAYTPSYTDATGPRSTLENYVDSLGLPYTGTDNSTLLDISKMVQLPTHAVMSHSEVAARGVHLRSVPFEAYAREFRRFTFKTTGVDAMDIAVADVGVNSQNYSVDMGAWKVGGHESVIIGGSGFAASSIIGSAEMVYHLEVITNPNTATLARPTSAVVKIPPSNYDEQVRRVASIPRISFSDIVSQVGDSLLGDVEGRISSAVGPSVGGLVSRLLAMAV